MALIIASLHVSIAVLGLILLGLKRQNDRREKLLRLAIYVALKRR